MDRTISASGRWLSIGGRPASRSAYVLARPSRWHTLLVWAMLVLLALCVVGFTLSLRSAGVLSGLIIEPATAAEIRETVENQALRPHGVVGAERIVGGDAALRATRMGAVAAGSRRF